VHVPDVVIVTALDLLSQQNDIIESVEIDRPGKLFQSVNESLFNDPNYRQQYGLNNIGQNVRNNGYGLPDADVDGYEALRLSRGSNSVTIAILDTEVDEHIDLQGRILEGWDSFSDTIEWSDECHLVGHGTGVAGVAAAAENNRVGIVGVNWKVKLLPIRIAGLCEITQLSAGRGIIMAADREADILQMSFGWYEPVVEGFLRDASLYAYYSGALLVASSGNDPNQNVAIPAAYPEVMAISGTDNLDQLADFSTFGPEISLAAPGVDIVTLTSTQGDPQRRTTVFRSGTSFSSPYVSGAAAHIMGLRPELSADQVRSILEKSSDDLGSVGFDNQYGNGRLNIFKALLWVLNP